MVENGRSMHISQPFFLPVPNCERDLRALVVPHVLLNSTHMRYVAVGCVQIRSQGVVHSGSPFWEGVAIALTACVRVCCLFEWCSHTLCASGFWWMLVDAPAAAPVQGRHLSALHFITKRELLFPLLSFPISIMSVLM